MSTIMIDPKVIQDQVRDQLLAGDPTFAFIPVISADPGDIVTAINSALQQIGIGVLILVPNMQATKPNLPGPFFDKIRLTAEVVENPTISRSASNPLYPNVPTAQNLTMLIAALLHRWAPAGVNEKFIVTDVMPVLKDADSGLNIWHVEMNGGGGVGYSRAKIAPVTATPAGPGPAYVTLSCATPGAAIWFTLDGSYPAPNNPSATLVPLLSSGVALNEDGTVAFTEDNRIVTTEQGPQNCPVYVPAGVTLSARAWLTGFDPTTPDYFTFPY